MNQGLGMSPYARAVIRLYAVALALTAAMAAVLYASFMIGWMHAPAGAVVAWVAALSALPLLAAFGLWRLAKSTDKAASGGRQQS